jgi:nucleoside-diphosphate-sugar epimerase
VLIGSAAAYGRSLWRERCLNEEASGDPDTLYAISKAASEQILWRLGDLYNLSVVVGRLATVFGPFEWPGGWRDTLCPILQVTDIARTGGRAVLPRDDRRDWLYSRDAAVSILQLLDAAAPRERLYNLGSGFVWSLADWCARLSRRYPGFVWSIGQGAGTPIERMWPGSPAALSQQRFAAEFGPAARHDLGRAFEDYLAWLEGPSKDGSVARGPGRV